MPTSTFFQPYDDFPFISMMTIEDWGFCRKGEGGKFVDEHDLRFNGDFPLSTDGGQLSGGQPGGRDRRLHAADRGRRSNYAAMPENGR